MKLGPVNLQGAHVRLEPLDLKHRLPLFQAAQSQEIWSWMLSSLRDQEQFNNWLSKSLEDQQAGCTYRFAVIDARTHQVLGSTSYLNVDETHHGVEIGSTWYSPSAWGTAINPEAKLLLMRHAFEDWGAIRVEYRTDHHNAHSQAAIKKLGATYEGTLRNHRIRPDGTIRNTLVFSITQDEWPDIQRRLQARVDAIH